MSESPQRWFRERLWPSVTFFLILLLIIPAMTVLLMPQSLELGIVVGVISYALLVIVFTLMSRRIDVHGSSLTAGHATIDVQHLGEMTPLDPHDLRISIGHRADARAFLMVSGWVKTGVKVAITDPEDPTPYWIITTRKPEELIEALQRARRATQKS